MIYETLYNYIQTTLEGVESVKKIISHPLNESEIVDKYPCVMYFHSDFDNEFSSVKDNFMMVRFKIFIIVGGKPDDREFLYKTVLSRVMDDVIAEFNEKWDGGEIDGHRVWAILNSGMPSMTVTDKGIEAWAEMNLVIKMQTTN